jgi:hypothetical protein
MDDKTITQGPKKQKLPGTLKTALAIFSLAGAIAVFILPRVAASFGEKPVPTFYQLALTGIALILLTSLLLGLAAKKLGFNRAWFLLALGYNTLIIIIKFILSPQSIYGQTIELSNFGSSFDPNSSGGYLFVGAGVSLVYLAVLGIIYNVFKKIFAAKIGMAKSFWKPKKKTVIILAIIGGVIALMALTAASWLLIPMLFLYLFAGSPILYLGYFFAGNIFSELGFLILPIIVLAIIFAIGAFSQTCVQAVKLRDSTILASFFWLALSLILAYHALWIVYMGVLASIWPFRTISPSGK